jgi:hypothetical protein
MAKATATFITLIALSLLAKPAWASAVGLYASPNGIDNPACSIQQPCTPQGAVMVCHAANVPTGVCRIQLADGVYENPRINIVYYRFVHLVGNCSNPAAVVLRTTTPGTLIWVQDHAIAAVGCMSLTGVPGTIGLAGRQHVIIDYWKIMFGAMLNGLHIALNEYSIASCGEMVWIMGSADVHAGLTSHSRLNLPCEINVNGAATSFIYFLEAFDFSIINAIGLQLTGSRPLGAGCYKENAIVKKSPNYDLAFSQPGNC